MNVEDVKNVEEPDGCMLMDIFRRQHQLMEKYGPIEERNGIGRYVVKEEPTFNIDSPRWQYLIKDFAWRTTEEVGEALDAVNQRDWDHAWEEIADGLHFLVEMALIAEMIPDDWSPQDRPGQDRLTRMFDNSRESGNHTAVSCFVRDLGMTMCCLKNKPWKQTQFPTDREKFRAGLRRSAQTYIELAKSFGMNAEDLYTMYFKKNQVNQFRIRSQY